MIWPLLVVLVAIAVYVNSGHNAFALDDLPLVRDNPDVRSVADLPRLFVRPYWPLVAENAGLYRPLTSATYALNRALTGEGPAGFHWVNIGLHAWASLLVWFVCRGASRHYGTPLLAGLLFALHPLHTEAVANIVGRAEILGAIGVMCAWLMHRRAAVATTARGRLAWTVAAATAYLAALLSKENVVLAPLLFVLDDRLRREESSATPDAGRPAAYLPYAAALGLGLVLRFVALGGIRGAENVAFIDNPAAFASTPVRLATAAWVQVQQLRLFVWPWPLSSDYSFDAIPLVDSPLDPRLWAGIAWLAALALLLRFGWRRSAPLALGVAIWILSFLPAGNFLFPAGTLLAERLAYLPSLGGCLIAAHLAAGALHALRGRGGTAGRLRMAAGCLVTLAALGLMARATVLRNPAWRDNLTLALTDVSTIDRSAKLHAGAGIFLHGAGDVEGAERSFRRALEIYPDYAQTHYNLGQLLVARGAGGEAIEHFLSASAIAPGNPRPYKSVAPLLETAGRTEEALEAYATGSRLTPRDLDFRFNYGRLLVVSDRKTEAVEVLEALARDDPRGLIGGLGQALALEVRGDGTGAARIYRALLARPGLPRDIRPRIEARLAAL